MNRHSTTNMNQGNGVSKTQFPGVPTRRAALGEIGNKINLVSNIGHQSTTSWLNKTTKQFGDLSLKKDVVVKKQTNKLVENKIVGCNASAVVPKAQPHEAPCKIPNEFLTKEEVVPKLPAFSATQLLEVEDIDKHDGHIPHLVSELVNDVYDHLRSLENKFTIKPNFLRGKAVLPRMRLILVDWLVQVHKRFGLLQETLFLAVAILDRVLQDLEITRKELQLVGVTSLFVASKYEERFTPSIADLVYVTDYTYTDRQILQMECLILRTLNFSFGRPVPLHFLRRNSKAGGSDLVLHTVAKYFAELTILDYGMVHYAPSIIAAAALCLARNVFNHPWTDTLVHYSKYTEEELKPVIRKLALLIVNSKTSGSQAIRLKYGSRNHFCVSNMAILDSPLIKKLANEEVLRQKEIKS